MSIILQHKGEKDTGIGAVNKNHITQDTVICRAGENVLSLAPITVDAGVKITAPSGTLWRII